MKKLTNLLRYVPKRVVGVAIAVLAIALPAAVMAWGPDRETFTMNNPAPYITFNSITDNPDFGDERNFLVIKDAANTSAGGWQDNVTAVPGKEYLVRVYVHNDAAANLNLKATNTRVKVNVPTTTGTSVDLGGFVTADNAKPKEVWDSAKLTGSSNFNVAYVAGSAKLYNNHFGQNGAQLSDNIVTSAGALVGYNKLDGVVPGCIEYSGYVLFKVKVQGPEQPKYDFAKEVRKSGTTDKYGEYVNAKSGDKVDFRLSFKNTGAAKLNNVVIKDDLPGGLTYVPESAKLYNSNYPNGYALGNTLFAGGANIGHYNTGINAFVVFTAQVVEPNKLPKCGINNLRNVAKVNTEYGSKEDDAQVKVDKKCEEPKKPIYECTGLNVQQISRTQFKFVPSEPKIENAEFVKFFYVIRDKDGKEVARTDNNSYSQSKPGAYSVQTYLVVKVDGKEQTPVTADKCKKPFEVKEQPVENKYACDVLDKVKVSRDTYDFTVKTVSQGNVKVKEYTFNFDAGKTNATKVVGVGQETQRFTFAEARDYTITVAVTFEVDGKTVPGVTSEKCKQRLTIEQPPVEECKPGIPMGDAQCEEKPETPEEQPPVSELPSTGPEAIVGGLFGSSALGLGVHSWLSSRRALKNVAKK